MYNLPEGNNHYLDDQDMICQNCEHKDDVDNGEYVNHQWYCDDCFKELFKVCPKCDVIISVDDELCEDCLEEKTYDESAEGMFEKLGYELKKNSDDEEIEYVESNETNLCNHIIFFKFAKTYDVFLNYSTSICISVDLHKAITQQMKELGWL